MSECALCLGVGSIPYEQHHEHVSEYGSTLCGCRDVLPPRDGTAQWWTLETVFEREVEIPIGHESANVHVRAEVPLSAENYRVHRRGNRYYPTLINLDVDQTSMTLHAHTARALGQALLDAAAASDAVDLPDTDPGCGHWAPCTCAKAIGR